MKIISLLISIMLIVFVTVKQATLLFPIQLTPQTNQTEILLKQAFGLTNPSLAESIDIASRTTGVSSHFLIALMHTESNFNQYAVSSKGYKGLMQIPFAVYYPDANIIIGERIFIEKMELTKGSELKAICLYKGYPTDSERGQQQAKKVLVLYERLRKLEAI